MKVLLDNTSFFPIVGGTETYCYYLLKNFESEIKLLCHYPVNGPKEINNKVVVRLGKTGLVEGYQSESVKQDLELSINEIMSSSNIEIIKQKIIKHSLLGKYYDEIDNYDPDIILVNDFMRVISAPYLQLYLKKGYKMVVNLHGILTSFKMIWDIRPEKKELAIDTIKKYKNLHFIAPSKYVYQEGIEWGIPKNRLKYIPLGIDTKYFKPASQNIKKKAKEIISKKLDIETKKLNNTLIGFPSRAVDHKGIDIALKALKKLNTTDPKLKWSFLIAGGSSDNPESIKSTLDLINSYNLNNRVLLGIDKFLEYPKDMLTLYHACDLLLIPSRRDALGYVALEGQACNIPIIGTSILGLSEAFGVDVEYEGEFPGGWIIKSEDDNALYDIIKMILENPQILKNKPNRRQGITKDYDMSSFIKLHTKYFLKILEM